MLVSVFSPKGGSGTSVVSALFAKALSEHAQTLLIDACSGDLEAILGIDEVPSFGFVQWANSKEPTALSLRNISVNVNSDFCFVAGNIDADKAEVISDINRSIDSIDKDSEKESKLVDSLNEIETHCVVDLGLAQTDLQLKIAKSSDLVIIVLRQCYLGLSKAMIHPLLNGIDCCVVVKESGRSISSSQIADVLKLNVVVDLDARRDFARTIDAGVLTYRTPIALYKPVQEYIGDAINDYYDDGHDIFEDSNFRNSVEFWEDAPRIFERDNRGRVFEKTRKSKLHSNLKERS